jgi:flagellar biosynthesis/type III secretory pathway protein FliH
LNAERYVRDKNFCMYPLLPAMQGVDHRLLKQAMDELTMLYTGDEMSLADRYLWMQVLIARSDTIDLEERFRIQKELHMYDPLLENHPKVKRIRAEGEAKGIAKGLVEGEAKGIVKGIARGMAEGEAKGMAEGEAKGIAKGIARGMAEGEAKGVIQGELMAARKMFVNVVRVRFPVLVELAQQEAMQIQSPETLDLLTQKVVDAANEEIVRWLLALPR